MAKRWSRSRLGLPMRQAVWPSALWAAKGWPGVADGPTKEGHEAALGGQRAAKGVACAVKARSWVVIVLPMGALGRPCDAKGRPTGAPMGPGQRKCETFIVYKGSPWVAKAQPWEPQGQPWVARGRP